MPNEIGAPCNNRDNKSRPISSVPKIWTHVPPAQTGGTRTKPSHH
jgi:hypothetical protein